MRTHWLETAEYVSDGDTRILGEDDNGALYIPSKARSEFWDRRFNRFNPTHWPYYLRSRRTNRVAFLESA
jgi:hypothetical protein